MNTATWRMTDTQLARTVAEQRGYVGKAGGWIYAPNGSAVAHGWVSFARLLCSRGWIEEGVGVNWRAIDLAARSATYRRELLRATA